jgi:molybdopterin biosynthesis enzyme
MSEMSVDELLNSLLELATGLPPLSMPLLDAHGATLAEDVFSGDRLVLKKDSPIRSVHVGMAASIGLISLPTRPHPRVVVISAGQDLVEPGQPLKNSESEYETNSWTLTTSAREAGATAFRVHTIPQTRDKLREVIEDQLVRADLVVMSGEQHDESFDLITSVLQELGEVNIVSPLLEDAGRYNFGSIGPDKTPVLTLPGDPLAAFIGAEIFLRPMIRSMLGASNLLRTVISGKLTTSLASPEGKRSFVRAHLTSSNKGVLVTPVSNQAGLDSVLGANGLISVGETTSGLPAGSAVDVIILERGV